MLYLRMMYSPVMLDVAERFFAWVLIFLLCTVHYKAYVQLMILDTGVSLQVLFAVKLLTGQLFVEEGPDSDIDSVRTLAAMMMSPPRRPRALLTGLCDYLRRLLSRNQLKCRVFLVLSIIMSTMVVRRTLINVGVKVRRGWWEITVT